MSDVLAELKEQQKTLQATLLKTADELKRVTAAIAALEGRPLHASARRNGSAVSDMIYGATQDMTPPFDHAALKKRGAELFPESADRIKQGVYAAVSSLIKHKKLERCPGGFRRAP